MIVSVLFGLLGRAAAEDLPEFVEHHRTSVVKLEARDMLGHSTGSGSGFFVSADGLVATNDHVAAMAPTVAVLADGTEREVLGLLATDPVADVAVIRIAGEGYTALPLGASVPPVRGDHVVVIGAPLGFDQSVSEGIVAALWPDGLPDQAEGSVIARHSLLQVTAAISPGSSGSPVLNAEGHVVGVAQSVSGAGYGASAAFAVDISAVTELLVRAPASGAITALPSTARSLTWSLLLLAGVVALSVAPSAWGWAKARRAEREGRAKRGRERAARAKQDP